MAPQTTASPYDEPPPSADTLSTAWCIPFVAFYAFGVLASMSVIWAAATFSRPSTRPPWPPAGFRGGDKRAGLLYGLVLYLPALLWVAVLTGGILCLLGCGLSRLARWLIRKLSPAPGKACPRDNLSPSRAGSRTGGVGGVPLSPAEGALVDAAGGDTGRVVQGTRGTGKADEEGGVVG